MTDETTRPKTLWSETQLEMLYMALEKHFTDDQIREIVNDLLGRGLPVSYLIAKAQEKCGTIGANRLRRLTGDN